MENNQAIYQPNGENRQERRDQFTNRDLPIWQVMPELIDNVFMNPVTVLKAQTGSGKTTQVPQALVEEGFHELGTMYVVQNRVVVAQEAAKRVAAEMGATVGREVGYLTGPDKNAIRDSRVVFVTGGVFKHIIRNNPSLEDVSVVIFDEFDERTLQSDIGLSLVQKAQEGGSRVRSIVMSATLDTEKISEQLGNAPVVESEGRSFPVTAHFERESIPDSEKSDRIAELVAQIDATTDHKDVLIFVPGKREMQETIRAINEKKLDNVAVLPLHSEMDPIDRADIFKKFPGKKIIVSTNIAERGLTIEGVTCVIDTGLVRTMDYDPETDTMKLAVGKCAKDSLIQRRGRAGRTEPGECYYLMTQEEYDARPESTTPEIRRTPLRDIVLQIKAMGYSREGDPLKLLDSPEKINWKQAKNELRLLGALDPTDETRLSEFGMQMSELGCDPRDAAMLLHAVQSGCIDEISKIAAIRMSRRLLYQPPDAREEARTIQRAFMTSHESDLINLLNVYRQAEQNNFSSAWCKKHFVSWPALREIRDNAEQLRQQVQRLGHNTVQRERASTNTIQAVMAKAFPDKVYERAYGDTYRNRETGAEVKLGRESHVVGKTVIAHEILAIPTARGELRLITSATALPQVEE